jgi:hypothetical protein
MLVQNIATMGANFVYPSHMKEAPSVLMYKYIELKIVTVLNRYIFIYSNKHTYSYSREIWFFLKIVRYRRLCCFLF